MAERRMAERRMALMALFLCLILCWLPCQALAVSTADAGGPIATEQTCSLTVFFRSGDIAFSQLPVRLYKIADASANCQYTSAAAFAGSGLILNGIQTAGEWNVIRSTLESYILANGIPADLAGVTDEAGKIAFGPLMPGLYLAMADGVVQNETTWIFTPALIALPGLSADGTWQYQVEVTSKSQIIPPGGPDGKTEYRVLKLWKGDSAATRPGLVEVEIFRNGASYQKVTLSEDNRWTYTWSAEDDGSQWKVMERNVPTGYSVTVEEREHTFVLTNTAQDTPDPPTPPKTGDTANVMLWVVLMILSGSMLILLGSTGKRKRL